MAACPMTQILLAESALESVPRAPNGTAEPVLAVVVHGVGAERADVLAERPRVLRARRHRGRDRGSGGQVGDRRPGTAGPQQRERMIDHDVLVGEHPGDRGRHRGDRRRGRVQRIVDELRRRPDQAPLLAVPVTDEQGAGVARAAALGSGRPGIAGNSARQRPPRNRSLDRRQLPGRRRSLPAVGGVRGSGQRRERRGARRNNHRHGPEREPDHVLTFDRRRLGTRSKYRGRVVPPAIPPELVSSSPASVAGRSAAGWRAC